ncbi:CDP-alcohol phosphatidyltransferase family protein [Dactylosporangium roseum]|uniref:CDP-alcohol phosphatidyltransferase family protein n=2 Tax=Dactylosporangium roseum TaxID=47989 RepID=A0ABY5ZGU7_9ACTN|nr:CDP-alcohol phosphatidyltransferase family protein [Dactylosporangium roseum]
MHMAYGIGATLVRRGVRDPNAVTAAGLLLSVAVPAVVAAGRPWAFAGAALVLLSAVADTVDGVLAVVAGRASRLGQVYDSAADRVAEACWLVAFVLLGGPVWLAVGCGAVMWLHEYVRARATVAGMTDLGTVTVAERPTRVLLAVFGLLAVAVTPHAVTIVLAVTAALTAAGLIQLIAAVRKALA